MKSRPTRPGLLPFSAGGRGGASAALHRPSVAVAQRADDEFDHAVDVAVGVEWTVKRVEHGCEVLEVQWGGACLHEEPQLAHRHVADGTVGVQSLQEAGGREEAGVETDGPGEFGTVLFAQAPLVEEFAEVGMVRCRDDERSNRGPEPFEVGGRSGCLDLGVVLVDELPHAVGDRRAEQLTLGTTALGDGFVAEPELCVQCTN